MLASAPLPTTHSHPGCTKTASLWNLPPMQRQPPKFSAPLFPSLFQPDSSLHIPLKSWHYQPGCCVTAATLLPECVCRDRPSSLCRVPRHVDPKMLHLLSSNCKKFTGSSQMPSSEFRGGSRVKISRSGIAHRRQHCAPPGFSPPSRQGFAPQNLHSGYDSPLPNASQPRQGRCEPGRGLSGMRTPHALQHPARPAAPRTPCSTPRLAAGLPGAPSVLQPPRALR